MIVLCLHLTSNEASMAPRSHGWEGATHLRPNQTDLFLPRQQVLAPEERPSLLAFKAHRFRQYPMLRWRPRTEHDLESTLDYLPQPIFQYLPAHSNILAPINIVPYVTIPSRSSDLLNNEALSPRKYLRENPQVVSTIIDAISALDGSSHNNTADRPLLLSGERQSPRLQ
jgi:hypothetical protein